MADNQEKEEPRIQASDYSRVVGNINVDGSVEGSMIFGDNNVVGYTAGQVSALIAQITTTFDPKPYKGPSPYKGLDVFQEKDAELFFGREKLVEDLLQRVGESRVVFVAGSSGSGKSSLVRAGLIPALKKAEESKDWLYVTIKPGRDPFESLASAFSRLKDPGLGKYVYEHADHPGILHECAGSVLTEDENQRLVLFIDQFEEVFTQMKRERAETFINVLAYAGSTKIKNGRVTLLFSLRSDFVPNCQTYPPLNGLLSQKYAFVSIGAMQPEELVRAIAQPALLIGLRIDPALIAQIINDMRGEPGALPLMQFALKDLFDSQKEKYGEVKDLNLNDYLERGGIHKALERHADRVFETLSPEEQTLARIVFSGLIQVGRGTQDTRRTAYFRELVPTHIKNEEVQTVVRKLTDARLLTTSTDESLEGIIVTISHEKLISSWTWLKKLVDENREAIAVQNEIINDANEWNEHKCDESFLYRGARLANAREKLQAKQLTLSGLAMEFIEAAEKSYADALEQEKKRADHLEELNRIALARQLAAQAQSILATRSSKQMTAVLLAAQSMKILPSSEAAQILLNNNFTAGQLSRMVHEKAVWSVDFSPDGSYVVSGSADKTLRVWEAATGMEIARMEHDDELRKVKFSPDGKWVLSCSEDRTIRVWDIAQSKEIARMLHDDSVNAVAVSSNGKLVVSGSDDRTVRVWDVARSKEVVRMNHDDAVKAVAFSPDGKYVVSGSADSSARLWDASRGKEINRIGHDLPVDSVAFSRDGKYVASGGHTVVRIWEASRGRDVSRLTHENAINAVAFSPDNQYLISGSGDHSARIWEVGTGRGIARTNHDGPVLAVGFSPDGRYVVSGSEDHTARVWEAATGREIARMTHEDLVRSVVFSPNGKHVISGSMDSTARVWDAHSRRNVIRMVHNTPVSSAAFSPDGRHIATGCKDYTACVWEIATGNVVSKISHQQDTARKIAQQMTDSGVSSVAFSPDGRHVVSCSNDKTARIWEAATGKETGSLIHNDWVNSVAFSPDGQFILSRSGGTFTDNSVRVWEIAAGREIARKNYDLLRFVFFAAFSPDGKYVASGGMDNTVRVWESTIGKEIARLAVNAVVSAVAFSPDGRFIASGSVDNLARVWEIETGRESVRMAHENSVETVAFSPDGMFLASGSTDNTARVWETATGREQARLIHDGPVLSVAFSPDSRYVASGSKDNTARVWEAFTGREVARISHDGQVNSVAFGSDGRYVLSAGDKTAYVWLWKPDDLLSNVCMLMSRNLTRAEWQQYIGNALPYQAVCEDLPLEPEIAAISSTEQRQDIPVLDQITTLLGQMKYEIEKGEDGVVQAIHKDYFGLLLKEFPFGVLFASTLALHFQGNQRKEVLKRLNRLNQQANVTRFYVNKDNVLYFEVPIPAAYENWSFMQFFKQIFSDYALLFDLNNGLIEYLA